MRATAAALVLTALAAVPAAAQQPDDFGGLVDTLAVLWSRGDAAGLAAHGARNGLDLDIRGQFMGSLEGRRAAAALRHLFGAQETVSVRLGAYAKVVGAEDRAFGEFIWVVRMPGAAVTETNRIFMALVREGGAWRVNEIRILR